MAGSVFSQRKGIVRSFAKAWYGAFACKRTTFGGRALMAMHINGASSIHAGRRSSAWPLAARAQQSERHAAHRRAHDTGRGRCGSTGPHRGVRAGAARNWAGPTAATCGSTIAGAGDAERMQIRGGIGRARAGRHPGLWQPRLGRCNRRPAPCRSYSRTSPIRSAPASSRAWRGRAAMPPDSRVRIRHQRKMAGAAQRDRTRRDARGGPS